MKKLTKKIMALMLSLVMILGCIPSFTNVVSANIDYYHLKIDNVNANIEKGNLALSIENESIEVSIKEIYKEDGSDQGTTEFSKFEPNNTYYVHYSFEGPLKANIKYVKGSNALIGFDVDVIQKKEGDNVVTDFSIPNKSHICQWKINEDNISAKYEGMITFTIDDWSTLSCAMEGTYPANASTKQTIKDFNNNDLYTVEDKGDVRTITLLQDVTATSKNFALNVINIEKNIVLDLNGHVLDRGLISADGTETPQNHGSVIEITGGKLTIKDSNPNVEHNGNILSNGLWHSDPFGETIIKGGIITGGTGANTAANTDGGGVFINENKEKKTGSLVLEAGTIAGNTSEKGGGVGINNKSSFTMNGGAISYNKSNKSAAGVMNETSSIFTMNAGEISHNTAEGTESVGGIYVGATTTINGGKIIYNKSEGYAGGVLASSLNLTISGNSVIKNNSNTQSWPQNLTTLTPAITIKIENLGDAEIYISIYDKNNGHKKGKLTSNCDGKGLNKAFFYDGPDTFYMDYNADGELEIFDVPASYCKIKVEKSENGTVTPSKMCAEVGDLITLTTYPDSGYAFDEYIVLKEGGEAIEVVDNKFTMPASNVLVSATFKEAPRPTSSGSKKYKADDKDTAEKVSGSGKKGSTRTITPIEGKKVGSVTVTDKDGNKVDVTLNEDGTYSFIQPASDVNVEVNYKNREITLNIGSTEASVDGEKSTLDVSPVVRNDRTMLPIRFVAENLGAKVEWNEKKPDYVAITRGDTKIEITLGSDIMLVNGKEVKLDSVAFAENDRTYLPVRAISEALNAIVEWNEEKPMEVKIYER